VMRRRQLFLPAIAACTALVLASCGSSGSSEANNNSANNGSGSAEEFNAEEYFKGKTIRFITTSKAGGGTDARIRGIARFLSDFIPGSPRVQVSNVTPHVAGINTLWKSEPDGLTIGMTSAPPLEFEFFEGAEWDSSEFEYITSYDSACDSMFVVRGDLPYDTIEEASGGSEPLITITSAPTPADVEPVDVATMLVAEYLDLPLQIKRVAESGTAELNLAFQRNEINAARYGADWCRIPDSQPGWLEDGYLVPLLDLGFAGPAKMADPIEDAPPHVSDVFTEEQMETYTGVVSASRAGGNPVFLPPGTPDEIVQALREAFEAANENEEYLEEVNQSFGGVGMRIISGEEVQELFTENLEVMRKFQDKRQEIIDELYGKYFK
jgi:tripartite-type tricarboxylate transporter receptor subunit TctC